MIIISHRGFWKKPKEKNHRVAFERAIKLGFGIETDVRDCQGRLMISHDMPDGREMLLDDFLAMEGIRNVPLAINIKADGLVFRIKEIMQEKKIENWFVFDMSIPDMLSYLYNDVPTFTRVSDIEKEPILLDKSIGVWLDSFNDDWYFTSDIIKLLNKNKKVCIVSPELHGRNPNILWEMLLPLVGMPNLMLCTDYPRIAKQYLRSNCD